MEKKLTFLGATTPSKKATCILTCTHDLQHYDDMNLNSTTPTPSQNSTGALTAQTLPDAKTEASAISEEIRSISERLDEMLSDVRDFLDKHPAR